MIYYQTALPPLLIGPCFGVALATLMKQQSESYPDIKVPLFIHKAIAFLEEHNGILLMNSFNSDGSLLPNFLPVTAVSSEGIFREAGSMVKMAQLRSQFDSGKHNEI